MTYPRQRYDAVPIKTAATVPLRIAGKAARDVSHCSRLVRGSRIRRGRGAWVDEWNPEAKFFNDFSRARMCVRARRRGFGVAI